MAQKKKHSRAEIGTKLAQADDLARQGKLQSEIARTLGVSIMTLHRWRKAPSDAHAGSGAQYETIHSNLGRNEGIRIAELELENSRLRRLVTDLLLEKIKLEEVAQKSSMRRASH
jgi:putative transposase